MHGHTNSNRVTLLFIPYTVISTFEHCEQFPKNSAPEDELAIPQLRSVSKNEIGTRLHTRYIR